MPKVRTVSVYEDANGEYRFRAQAGNNRIIAVSGESFINRSHAIDMAVDLFPDAALIIEDIAPPESQFFKDMEQAAEDIRNGHVVPYESDPDDAA